MSSGDCRVQAANNGTTASPAGLPPTRIVLAISSWA